jgi:glutathione peroxidase
MNIYDYSVPTPDGKELALKDFEGKVMMIVNTATECGFTPQYEDLESIYHDFHDKGLEIIDVPCNQFAGQAPGSDEEIQNFCSLNYNTEFPQMQKSDVNGEHALPLYTYLKSQKGFEGFGKGPKALAMNMLLKKVDKDYKHNPEIKWNFTKFIIDRQGNVVARFEPTTDMKEVRACVEGLL